jgi:threonine/homoserine/homoserine lactone efflux protein
LFGTHDLLLFSLTVLVLNATPGVDLLFTLTRTLQHGARAGVAAVLGINAGCVVHTLAAAFGLAALLAASAAAFSIVKWAGAAYLAWLAWGMLRTAWRGPAAPLLPVGATAVVTVERDLNGAMPPAFGTIFRQGLLTNALNPKVALFFLALLPQFIAPDAAHKELAFLFLGGWFIVQGGASMLLFVWLVVPLRRWRAPVAFQRGLFAGGAALFAILAARLAVTPRG